MKEFVGSVLPYVAAALLVLGVVLRVLKWRRMPKHLRWTLYPAPASLTGQARFMAGEIFTFHAIFHRNRVLWAGAWLFHVAMGITFLGLVLFAAGLLGPWLLLAGLSGLAFFSLYLMAYRLMNPAARRISTPVEFMNLGLFTLMGIGGLALALSGSADPEQVRAYFAGLARLAPVEAPGGWFLLALLAAEAFLVYFPFSRMIHMVSKWFAFHKINWQHEA